jgi:lipopolysaccharide transport system ATP-binding protein
MAESGHDYGRGIGIYGMSELAIRVAGLSKKYRIGGQRERYKTLRDSLADAAAAPFQRLASLMARRKNGNGCGESEIWALSNVEFEVSRGDVVGVIGHNGAGKSTLLKILSRITEPTSGHAEIHGRVGSLLEVGTGFHLELTGRENIYLNGAILGMKRAEIERKFDEIIAFAGVEKFVDTPVKHYSTGMHLRLAFAVAAHLEPEILLVDEVLAVGDAAFQKRCLGKIGDIAAEGRTVLFVSHNLGAVKELCNMGLVLRNGLLAFRGSVAQALAFYGRTLTEAANDEHSGHATGWRYIYLNGCSDGSLAVTTPEEPLQIHAGLELDQNCQGGLVFLLIEDFMGQLVVHRRAALSTMCSEPIGPGRYRVTSRLPAVWLAPGVYTVYLKLIIETFDGQYMRYLSEKIFLEVDGATAGLSRALLAPPCEWSLTSWQAPPTFHQVDSDLETRSLARPL